MVGGVAAAGAAAGRGSRAHRRRLASTEALKKRPTPSFRHPCKGERGLFATRRWRPFQVVGEYVGRVGPPDLEGGFVLSLEDDVPQSESLSLDAGTFGNEIRYVNDYRHIGHQNVVFQSATIGALPVQLLVVTAEVLTVFVFLLILSTDTKGRRAPHGLRRRLLARYRRRQRRRQGAYYSR